ncbi:hypothetical protein F5X98DRAFT_391735 [Xylaria grammica]|nr:hypothetical protein F5X98DRAFT_391735 [Xylaria grammica]
MASIRKSLQHLISYLILALSILPLSILSPFSSPSPLFLLYPLLSILPHPDPQTTPTPIITLQAPFKPLSEIGITLMTYTWTIFFLYPAHIALVSFGWAMQPFEPDAVDLYLSLGL